VPQVRLGTLPQQGDRLAALARDGINVLILMQPDAGVAVNTSDIPIHRFNIRAMGTPCIYNA
jgi:hypothetical protein